MTDDLTPCTHCGVSIPAGYLTCDRCTDYLRDAFEHANREQNLLERWRSLGWSAQWHGLPDNRWCSLYRMHGRGSLTVSMDLHGQVLLVVHHGRVDVRKLARWLGEL